MPKSKFTVKKARPKARKTGRKLTDAQRGSIDFSGGKGGADRYGGYVPRQR